MSGRLLSCSIRNLYLASLFVCLSLCVCGATTIIYVVTPAGIVIGADGLVRAGIAPCGGKGSDVVSTAFKIFLLKHRLVLASRNVQGAKAKDGRTALYDFPAWTKFIDHNTSADTTVEALSRIVESEGPKALSFLLEDERFACNCIDDPFGLTPCVEYIIAGYDSGVPMIYSVKLEGDWKRHIIIPMRIPVQPGERERIDSRFGGFGVNSIIFAVCKPKTDAYIREVSRFPSYAKAACADDFTHFTLEQASDMVRVFLGIEAEIHPDSVGFPLTIVTLPKPNLHFLTWWPKAGRGQEAELGTTATPSRPAPADCPNNTPATRIMTSTAAKIPPATVQQHAI